MSPTPPSLVWYRQDLRVDDHEALRAASRAGGPVVPVYIDAPVNRDEWSHGAASRWWLHHSLAALDGRLRELGSRLILRRGAPAVVLRELAGEAGARSVYYTRQHEPAATQSERDVARALDEGGVDARPFAGQVLFDPDAIRTGNGDPYRVFTPYYKACLAADPPAEPLPEPDHLPAPQSWPASLELDALGLLPEVDWAGGLRETWRPGAAGAHERLDAFLKDGVADYPQLRDRPDLAGTGRMSPHLHFGEISPRMIWHLARRRQEFGRGAGLERGIEDWLRQLVWREFAHHLLHHFPDTPTDPLRPEFAAYPWARDNAARARQLRAWRRGRTGYPIVDAGMRELWHTGWMHNRVRMIVASFLVKDLLIPWQEGAAWFWDTLVDADLANNTLGWQWTAGCGADAAPYFRIFNPTTQGRKFDPDGVYIRRWIPELGALSNEDIHSPAEAAPLALREAGIELGGDYPEPLVDHRAARERALEGYERVKAAARGN